MKTPTHVLQCEILVLEISSISHAIQDAWVTISLNSVFSLLHKYAHSPYLLNASKFFTYQKLERTWIIMAMLDAQKI